MSIPVAGDAQAFWHDTPLGARLAAAEQALFDHEVADIFGFNAFQVGEGTPDFLHACRIPLRVRLSAAGTPGLRADPAALPLASGCADLLVLPHVLEFHPDPHQVLREAARVLMPEGHVVLTGFNPWSALGLRQRLARAQDPYPWCGRFLSLARIKDWMALLGLELRGGRMCGYLPALESETWLRRMEFLEAAGDRWWPIGGGVYFLHGVKRVAGMRLVLPNWRREFAAAPALSVVPRRAVGGSEPQQREETCRRH